VKINVILADDHAIVRDGLCALLEFNPEVEVVGSVSDGHQVINLVQKLHPDLVIMDISMPEVNGIHATQRILELSPNVGVIILSMFGTPEHIYHALQAGARGYLLKESAGRELMDAIQTVHAGKFYLSHPVLSTLITDYLHVRTRSHKTGPLELLSQREREILQLVVEGKTSAEIAETLYLSPKTVESYRSRMMKKLGTPDMPSLIKLAVQEGLIT
jgi:DNA-binding NarL/FixJ family response regulator